MKLDNYISDNNQHRILSEVNVKTDITFFNIQVHQTGTFCALVDCNQPATTAIFVYNGSLA